MEKVSILSAQKRRSGQGKKDAAPLATQADRLTHSIMNQLTVIYCSCAKVRRNLAGKPSANENADIQIIESAVATVAVQVEALRFRLEKITRARPKTLLKESHKQFRSRSKLSVISAREITKT